jgi:TRAP-type C4-dicarboxylate transport system substrate-binding protein
MKHWKMASLFLFLCVVGVSFVIQPSYAQKEPIELTFTTSEPALPADLISVYTISSQWGKEIEKRTNGRVKVTVFTGGTLASGGQCYDSVAKGLCDVGYCVLAWTRGRFPLTEVIDLPLGYRSALEATKLINIYYKKFNPKEFDDVKVMYLHAPGPSILGTKKSIRNLEEFKGTKISCTGLMAKIVSALGGVPVAMTMPERYDAIKRGVAEGCMNPIESFKTWKLAEVVNYVTETFGSSSTSGMGFVMNKGKWASLPTDIQKIIQEINEEWIVKTGELWEQADKDGYDLAVARGIEVITLPEKENERWQKMVQPILDDYVKVTNAKGLPGTEALKFCREELKKLQK